jgi:hypothetical protein
MGLLEAGHELDKRAAEVVLGWTDWRDHHGTPAVKAPGCDSRPFKPSLILEDAFILLDRVLDVCRGQVRIQKGHSSWSTVNFFHRHNSEDLEYACGAQETLPLAICEATIEAMMEHRRLEAGLAEAEKRER